MVTLSISTLSITTPKDTRHNDTKYNLTKHNGTKNNYTKPCNTCIKTISITILNITSPAPLSITIRKCDTLYKTTQLNDP
jgi:hypothetical protein